MSSSDRFLRLDNLQVIGDSCRESILRLCQGLLCEIDGAACDFDLLGGCIQIKQRGSDFVVDLAAQIAQLRASLLQLGISFEHISVDTIAGKNRNTEAAVHLPSPV